MIVWCGLSSCFCYTVYSEILPKLIECQSDPSGLIDLFALSSPQFNFLYVNYCIGRHRSEDIYKDNSDYLEVGISTPVYGIWYQASFSISFHKI